MLTQFFLRKHPDGRVAGQKAAGLNAVTLEPRRTLDRWEQLDKAFLSADATTFAGARVELCEPRDGAVGLWGDSDGRRYSELVSGTKLHRPMTAGKSRGRGGVAGSVRAPATTPTADKPLAAPTARPAAASRTTSPATSGASWNTPSRGTTGPHSPAGHCRLKHTVTAASSRALLDADL